MLAQHFTGRGASHIHGNIAAADHQYFLADGEPVTEIDVEQKIDALIDAIKIYARNGEIAAAVRTHGDQHRIEVAAQIGNGEVTACRVVEFQRDIAGREDFAYLRLDNIAGETILRQTEIKHSTGNLRSFEDGDGITHQGEVVRSRKTYRSCAHHGNAKRKPRLGSARVHIDRTPRLRSVAFGKEALECTNGYGLVDHRATAGCLAGMRTNAAADAGHGIRLTRNAVCLFKFALGNQAQHNDRRWYARDRPSCKGSWCSTNPCQPSCRHSARA